MSINNERSLMSGESLKFFDGLSGRGAFPHQVLGGWDFLQHVFLKSFLYFRGFYDTLFFTFNNKQLYNCLHLAGGGRETFLAYDRGTLSYHRKLIISTPATDVISGTSLISTELIIYKYMKNNGTDQTTVCGRVFVWMQYTLMILYTDLCRSASSTDPYD